MDDEHTPFLAQSRELAFESGGLGYAVSLSLIALVTAVAAAVFRPGNLTNVGLLYLVPVMVAATRFGLRTGLITGLVSSLAYNFFFIPPLHTFIIDNPENIVTVLMLLGVAVVSSQLAARVREQARLAQRSAAESQALASFAQQLTGLRTRVELAMLPCVELGRLFETHAVLLVPGENGLAALAASPADAEPDRIAALAGLRAFEANQPTGLGSDTLAASKWSFWPIASGGRVHAVLGMARLDARTPVGPEQLPLLRTLLAQAGLAFERNALEDEMAMIAQLKERDRLRAALLSSISHDLRTPLTTVLGTLAEIRPASDEQARQLSETRREAERLHRFIANLLDMVRVESGALHPSAEPVDLAEAVAEAFHDLRRGLTSHRLHFDLPADLPLVLVDPRLLHHCLINLLENAAKFAPEGSAIAVWARRLPNGLGLSVLDEGVGIPVGDETRIFEMYARIEGSDRRGGTGLGLAIVKAFAEAMGLTVEATNRCDRPGACFTLRIPEGKLRAGQEVDA
ncbi:MAG: DUF4118 domain-containing protein [Novosphingobium sp.]